MRDSRDAGERYGHWQKTQLEYDDTDFPHSRYTWSVIRRGHALVRQLCHSARAFDGNAPVVVDVGCGWTDIYDKVSDGIRTYVGVEPSAGQLLQARPQPNKFLVRGTGENLPLVDGCADCVLMVSSLDHCHDADLAISEAFRVARAGGTVVILLENKSRISNAIRGMFKDRVWHGDEHLYFFDMKDIAELTKAHGDVIFGRSIGFLLGFRWLSGAMPESLMDGLNRVGDAAGAALFPSRGQHFVVAVRKRGTPRPAADLRFACPSCRSAIGWSDKRCGSCQAEIGWIEGRILDALRPGLAAASRGNK